MILKLLWIFLTASVGSLGFAVILRVPRRGWVAASLIGGLGYAIDYFLLEIGIHSALAMFVGCLVASLLSQYSARKLQMIATSFVTVAIIPCVPGIGLYRCMYYLGQGMNAQGLHTFVSAMVDILMIAMALGTGAFLVSKPWKKAHHE